MASTKASKELLKERLKQRKRAMEMTQDTQNTLEDTTSGSTWGAALEMTERSQTTGLQMMEDVERAPDMLKELETRRREKQKELNKASRMLIGDVSAEIRSARKKSGAKVQEDVNDMDMEASDIKETALSIQGVSDTTEDQPQMNQEPSRSHPGLGSSMRKEGLASLKERVRDSLVKKQAAKAQSEQAPLSESQPQRKLKGIRGRPPAVTRFDEGHSTELEDQLSKSAEARRKWKKVIDETKKESALPTREEQYDFFTCTYDDAAYDEEIRTANFQAGLRETSRRTSLAAERGGPSTSADQDMEAEPEHETDDRTALIPSTETDSQRDEGYVIVGSEYIPTQTKIANEKLVLFVPSTLEVPISEKIEEGCEPRDLAEEGYYIGSKPLVTTKGRNKMEQRLIAEKNERGKKWFGEDGAILSLPDPVKQTPNRPTITDEEVDPAIQTIYRKPITKDFDSRYIDGSMESEGQYRLDVDVNSITFSHHDLMSREHVLASRLQSLADQYTSRKKQSVTEYYSERIRALKAAILHIEETKLNIKNKGNEDVEAGAHHLDTLEKRRQDYVLELRDMRVACDNEERADRDLLRNLTKTWTSLKKLRTYQNCVNTPIKLNFQKEDAIKKKDMEDWKREKAEHLEEARMEFDLAYPERCELYRQQLAKYDQQQKAKREAEKREKRKLRRKEDEPDLLNVEQDLNDKATLEEPDLIKPDPPEKFDEKRVRALVEEKFKHNRRRPGEPKLIPELSYNANVTSQQHCPLGEQQRRDSLHNCRIYAQIFFNNKAVAKTDVRRMNQDFTISFAQIIPINIIQWPDSITIQIYEVGAIMDRLLTTLYTPIPATTVTSESAQLESLEFSSESERGYNHEGVGSGVPIRIDIQGQDPEVLTLLTSGELKCSVSWGVDDQGNPLIPVRPPSHLITGVKSMDAVAEIGASAMMDIEKLSQWLKDSRIDPNDPTNAELVYLLRPKGGGDSIHGPEYFRLEQLQEEFNFVTDEEINNDVRFKLLELREKGVPEFRNLKLIAANSSEVQADIFKDYNKRIDEQARIEDQAGDSHRAIVTKFMQRVREQVLERKRLAAHQKTLREVVYEEEIPNISALVLNLGEKLERRHPLRPTRKARKPPAGTASLQDGDVQVIINISRAQHIPCRQEPDTGERSGPRVRPFFEVIFQKESRITTVAEGPNPSWNEELNIHFRAPNSDYTPTNLQTVKDNIYINLFDEYLVDILDDERQRDRVLHKRIERIWLGGLIVPFSTLYANGMITGELRLDSPSVLLGYERHTDPSSPGTLSHSYVSLYMTIEPSLGVAPELNERFESNEPEDLLDAAELYMTQCNKSFPNRSITTAVMDINGKTVFVTKYFKPLEPPQAVINQPGDKLENIARFVSMIPYLSDSVTYPGMCDIWSTCDQFLQMLTGDEEEHAVLLTNYFLSCGADAYLCIGVAIPEGITAYTVVREGDKTWLWNSLRGEKYNANDNYCPLKSVGCLINPDNIWANIQSGEEPNRISWNLGNAKAWKPFFTSKFVNPGLMSVQPERLVYFETDRQDVDGLQAKIEHHIRMKFEREWRSRFLTRWSYQYVPRFRAMLESLEMNKNKTLGEQVMRPIKEIESRYKLTGLTLNMTYTDLDTIADRIFSTGIWQNETTNVEFSLAVHIHPYPSSVLSVWIYIASLMKI